MKYLIRLLKYSYLLFLTTFYIFMLIFIMFWFWIPYLFRSTPEVVLEKTLEYTENFADENELF